MLAIYPLDWQLHDTHFVVARFHYLCSERVRHDTSPAAMGWPLNTY